MATTVARLQAVLTANTRDFDRAMQTSETKTKRVGRAAGIAGVAIATGVAFGVKHAIADASNLHEQMNKTEVVFRQNGKSVIEWSKHLAHSFGLSDRAALEFAGTFGNMLKPMGIAIPKVTKMSKELVQLSGDMASFNNADISDTLHAIQSGLAGQVRPLRQYGVFLDKDRIALEAVNSGLVKAEVDMPKVAMEQIKLNDAVKDAGIALAKSGKGSEEYQKASSKVAYEESRVNLLLEGKVPKLTAAQKAQASYNIIVRDTADAHGDFERTAGGLANQQRILQAQYENLSASLGMVLLPAMTKVMGVVIKLTGFFEQHHTTTKLVTAATAALGAAFLLTAAYCKVMSSALVSRLIPALAKTTAGQWLLNIAVEANPYVAAATAIAILVVALIVLQKKYNAVTEAVQYLTKNWWLLLIPLGLVPAAIALIIQKFGLIEKGLDVVHAAVGGLNAGLHALNRALERLIDLFKSVISFAGKVGGVLGKIGGVVGGVAGKIGDAAGAATARVNAPPGAIPGGGSGPASISPRLWDELAGAHRFGLTLTSGYRPGAVTKHGTPSDHGIYPSHAIDVAGRATNMAGFFRWLIGQRDVKQAFYDPLGSIFNGVLSSYREGGHSDHVHVATYDQGGWLKPGLTLAANNTGRPERVGGGDVVIPVSIGGEHVATVIFDMLRRQAKVFENRNGRPAFGGA